MHRLLLPFTPRFITFTLAAVTTLAIAIIMATTGASGSVWWLCLAAAGGLSALGVYDLLQERHAILRNYPIAAHLRFLLEEIRPGDAAIFLRKREGRRAVQPRISGRSSISAPRRGSTNGRSEPSTTSTPAATSGSTIRSRPGDAAHDFRDHGRRPGLHAALFGLGLQHLGDELRRAQRQCDPRAEQGRQDGRLRARYRRGRLQPAITREFGGDIIWEIGTRLFRLPQRRRHVFARALRRDSRQSANQDDRDQAEPRRQARPWRRPARRQGDAPRSPPCAASKRASIAFRRRGHSTFSTPIEMMHFIAELRELSGGKPVGFKLCVGHPWEFIAICKAMLETGIYARLHRRRRHRGRHRRGAAGIHRPCRHAAARGPEFRAQCARRRQTLRDRISSAPAARSSPPSTSRAPWRSGADWCNAARGFMFAVGCIQSQQLPHRPLPDRRRDPGLQAPARARGADKAERVRNFHTPDAEGAGRSLSRRPGCRIPASSRWSISRAGFRRTRCSTSLESYPPLEAGALLAGVEDLRFKDAWTIANPESFRPNDSARAHATKTAPL